VRDVEIANGPYAIFCRDCNDNIFERLITRDNYESGLQIQSASSNNQVINLDSYGNRDPRKNGESADGLAIKEGSGSGNVVRGARLWNNSDDGFDAWLFTVVGSPRVGTRGTSSRRGRLRMWLVRMLRRRRGTEPGWEYPVVQLPASQQLPEPWRAHLRRPTPRPPGDRTGRAGGLAQLLSSDQWAMITSPVYVAAAEALIVAISRARTSIVHPVTRDRLRIYVQRIGHPEHI
jgi:hypothetical protein